MNSPYPIAPGGGGGGAPLTAYIAVYLSANNVGTVSGIQMPIAFDQVLFQSNMTKDASGNIIPSIAGWYQIDASGICDPMSAGTATYFIYQNSTPVAKSANTFSSFNQTVNLSALINCAAGDLISFQYLQNSGSNKNVIKGAITTFMHAYRILQ